MGLGDVQGASDRAEGVIVSRSLEDVDDGVRFSYVVRPALGGRIAVTDEAGDAVTGTFDSDTEPESLTLENGALEFELPIEAGTRERVALIVHDIDVGDLTATEPTVERLRTDESDAERPSGVFGRLGGLLGGSGEAGTDGQTTEDGVADGDGADPLDVAALEALSDDVPETPADVIEGATQEESDSTESDDSGASDDGDSPSGSDPEAESPLESAVDEAVSDTDGGETTDTSAGESDPDDAQGEGSTPDDVQGEGSIAHDTQGEEAAGTVSPEQPPDASSTSDPDDGSEKEDDPEEVEASNAAESAIDIAVPDAPDADADEDDHGPAPGVPAGDDSVLAELVDELEGEDASAHRAALLEALGLSAVTAEDIETIRERQLAIRDAVEDLRTQARETRQAQADLESQVDDVDEVVEAIRDEVSTLHRGCSVLEEEVTGFSDRLTALEEGMEDVDALREEVERAESQREQLTEGIKAIDDRIDEFGDQRARLQDRLDHLESTIQELEAFRSSLARAFDQTGGGGQGGRPGGPGGR